MDLEIFCAALRVLLLWESLKSDHINLPDQGNPLFQTFCCVTKFLLPLVARSEDVLRVVEQRLDDDVLLHHVEREVLLRLEDGSSAAGGGRPHEGGPEDDGQVGDLHPVGVLLLDDAEEVAEEGGEGGAVRRRHGR